MFKHLIILFGFISILSSSELNWNDDYDKALAQAKAQDKDIYLLITSSDCRWCRKFESTTMQDKELLSNLSQKYVFIQMNKEIDDIDSKFNTKSVPRHYFITKEDKIIHTFLGAWNREDFNSFLKDVDKKRESNFNNKENK